MTPQEIIQEIQKLPPFERREILDRISTDSSNNGLISEEDTAKQLLAKGIINEIPADWDKADEDFEPIEIKGKPLSETLIEDRG